jgi:hypothetical protein
MNAHQEFANHADMWRQRAAGLLDDLGNATDAGETVDVVKQCTIATTYIRLADSYTNAGRLELADLADTRSAIAQAAIQ